MSLSRLIPPAASCHFSRDAPELTAAANSTKSSADAIPFVRISPANSLPETMDGCVLGVKNIQSAKFSAVMVTTLLSSEYGPTLPPTLLFRMVMVLLFVFARMEAINLFAASVALNMSERTVP